MRLSIERIKIMKKFKKLLSVMALGVLLITNVVSVSVAEKEQPAKKAKTQIGICQKQTLMKKHLL